ncbi:hypothetical protein ACLOJK_007604 [Asimina triloba]
MGQRANYAVALEARAVDAVEKLRQDLYIARLEQEPLKEDMVGLLIGLAVAKAEQDEVVDDAEATILAKKNLEKALVDDNAEIFSLRGMQI